MPSTNPAPSGVRGQGIGIGMAMPLMCGLQSPQEVMQPQRRSCGTPPTSHCSNRAAGPGAAARRSRSSAARASGSRPAACARPAADNASEMREPTTEYSPTVPADRAYSAYTMSPRSRTVSPTVPGTCSANSCMTGRTRRRRSMPYSSALLSATAPAPTR